MEIHHSISKNTLSFLVEKIFDFKVSSCPKLSCSGSSGLVNTVDLGNFPFLNVH